MPDETVAVVSLTTGNPADPDGVIAGATWLIGGTASATAFRQAMTERYGEPVESAQAAGDAGADNGLVIFGGTEGDDG